MEIQGVPFLGFLTVMAPLKNRLSEQINRFLALSLSGKALRRVGQWVIGIPFLLMRLLLYPLGWVLAKAGVRFFYSSCLLSRFGHLAIEPYYHIKAGLLGLRPLYRGVVLAPSREVTNPYLLNCWKKYLTVIQRPWLVALLRPLAEVWCVRLHTRTDERFWIRFPEGDLLQGYPAMDEIEVRYTAQFGSKPLIALSHSDIKRGWKGLRELGILNDRDAWFACLHIRESGSTDGFRHRPNRDADVFTYFMAVKAIVARGGWVVRMGDPRVKPLPAMEGLIDYAHSPLRSDWMDVFCLSQCRFTLGTASGPSSVSFVFGRPSVGTNWSPVGFGPLSAEDIYIPKLYWSLRQKRYLTFKEILLSGLREIGRAEEFEAAQVTWVNNSPEEIRDVTLEMLDRLEGKLGRTPSDEEFQAKYRALFKARATYGTLSRVGRDFLRKYAWLLPEESKEAVAGATRRQIPSAIVGGNP